MTDPVVMTTSCAWHVGKYDVTRTIENETHRATVELIEPAGPYSPREMRARVKSSRETLIVIASGMIKETNTMRRSIRSVIGMMLAVSTLATTAATAAEPICVLPLGDSITAGSEGGYRKPLMATLAKHGLKVTTVGSVVDPAMPAGVQAHEGHPGWRLDQLADHLLGPAAGDEHGGYWLVGGHDTGRGPIRPSVITLMAGINDINQMMGTDPTSPMAGRTDEIVATLQTRLKRIVGILDKTLPDATILLGGCTPYANGLLDEKLTGATETQRKQWASQDGVSPAQELGTNHWVILFNRWIRDVYVPELQEAGKKVAFVDLYAPFILPDGSVRGWDNREPQNSQGPAAYGDYGLHPNRFGYGLIAQAFAPAIEAHAGK